MEFTGNPILRKLHAMREFGLEYALRRFYGLYGAVVESNDDPRQQGRVSARIGVLGVGTRSEAGEFTPDVHPKMLRPMSIYAGEEHGIYFPPEIGDVVYVSFDHGDPQTPRYHGSYWCNPDDAKTADTSHVPTEFKTPGGGPPTKRGIKTKFGHGMVFSDDENEPFVTIWSGQQEGAGAEATKKQKIRLSDVEGDDGIYVDTFYGHKVYMNDTEKTVLISGLSDDPAGEVANSIKIDDNLKKITIKTKGMQMIEVDDTTGRIAVTGTGIVDVTAAAAMNLTAGGAIILSATGGIAQGSGAAPPAGAPGVAIETGAGAKIVNFAGAVTETLGGLTRTAATQLLNAATSFTINSPLITIGPPGFGITLLGGFVTIGNLAAAQKVCNEQLITFLKDHRHTGNLGAPTPLFPADAILLQDPANPALPNPLYVTETKMS